MIRPGDNLAALAAPALTWDEDGAPRSREFADRYFARGDGAAETRHVFLAGNDLPRRFADSATARLCIGELGFGSGLNFLLTWALLREAGHPDLRLHYWSIDRQPLRARELERALRPWPQLAPLLSELLRVYPPPLCGVHRRVLDGGRLVLDCVWAEAAQALEDLAGHRRPVADAWYLDGFAPSRNGSMWSPALLATLARCSRPGATLASYSAAGSLRRALAAAGFGVHKRPGHGPKRECIHARLERPAAPAPGALTPWDLPAPAPATSPSSVLVLGAGLAGAHAAAALARRGLEVTVLEATRVAAAASGNPQGILFNRLSHRRGALSDFSLYAFLHARALYAALFDNGELRAGRDGSLGGCFLLPGPRGDATALAAALRELAPLAVPLSAAQAAARLGVEPAADGLWQPGSGWLAPAAVCRALLAHPAVALRERCPVAQLRRGDDGSWEARGSGGEALAAADAVVIAAGAGSAGFLDAADWLPLRLIRGQTTQLPARGLPPLRASYCHSGYLAPALDGEYCLGASFRPGDHDCGLRAQEHRENLEALAAALPAWREALSRVDPERLRGRAGLRCSTPDYLPLIGPLPQAAAFRERYAALARDARQRIDRCAPVHPRVYLSCGHGSRGLGYSALAGELLASQLCDEPPPLPRDVGRAVAPARFLLRELVRGR